MFCLLPCVHSLYVHSGVCVCAAGAGVPGPWLRVSGHGAGLVWSCAVLGAWSFRVIVCLRCVAIAGSAWSCGLVVWSGHAVWSCVPGVRRVHGLVVIILPYNTKHYYYGRTRYWCTDWHGLRRWPLVRVGRVTSGQGSGSGATPAWRSPIHPGSYLLYVLNTITLW